MTNVRCKVRGEVYCAPEQWLANRKDERVQERLQEWMVKRFGPDPAKTLGRYKGTDDAGELEESGVPS